MRLIDADALIERWCGMKCGCEREECGREIEPCIVVMAIEEAPTIDAVEVVRGEWKRKIVDSGFNADWVCSECGYRVKTDFVDYNYCPNCGARMKGADDE